MRTGVLWGLLALLGQLTLVSSHILGRPSSTSDLVQLKVRDHNGPSVVTPALFEGQVHSQLVNNVVYLKVRDENMLYSSCAKCKLSFSSKTDIWLIFLRESVHKFTVHPPDE